MCDHVLTFVDSLVNKFDVLNRTRAVVIRHDDALILIELLQILGLARQLSWISRDSKQADHVVS